MRTSRKRFLASAASPGFVVLASRAGAATLEYKLAHNLPASHPVGVGANEFAAAVRHESGGRLDIKVFPDNQLGSDSSMVEQLRVGGIQLHLQGLAPLSAIAPVAGIALVGFPFRRREDAVAAMDGAVGEIIRTALEGKGILVFEKSWVAGFRQITTSTRPIRIVDDLAGLKIRVIPNAITVDLFKTLGAAAVPIAFNELYTSLQTHIVDAADGPYLNIYALRQYEVQRFLSVTNHQWSGYLFCANPDAWKSLPSDLQTIVRRNANLAGKREDRASALQDASVAEHLVRLGMRMNRADTAPFRARLGGYYQRWKNEFGPAAWAALEQYSGKLA